jgi:hypothetical protein
VWHSKTLAAYLDYIGTLWDVLKEGASAAWDLWIAGATATWNVLKDLGAKIGDCIGWLFGMGQSGGKTFDDLGASVFKFLGDMVSGVAMMVRNWDISLQLIWEYIKLGFFNAVEIVRNFGHNAATLIGWLGEDLGATFNTMVSYVTTVFTNLGKNIMAVWTAVLEFIKGNGFNPDWTPMLDGFKSTMSKMPNMTKAATQESNAAIDSLNQQLADREIKRALDKAKAEEDAKRERERRAAEMATKIAGAGQAEADKKASDAWKKRNQAERDKQIKGGGPGLNAPGLAAGKQGGDGPKAAFVGLTELASKLQTEAGHEMLREQKLANHHLGRIAAAVEKPGGNQGGGKGGKFQFWGDDEKN